MMDTIEKVNKELLLNIRSIILNSRKNVLQTVNRELIISYWSIGKEIVEN